MLQARQVLASLLAHWSPKAPRLSTSFLGSIDITRYFCLLDLLLKQQSPEEGKKVSAPSVAPQTSTATKFDKSGRSETNGPPPPVISSLPPFLLFAPSLSPSVLPPHRFSLPPSSVGRPQRWLVWQWLQPSVWGKWLLGRRRLSSDPLRRTARQKL